MRLAGSLPIRYLKVDAQGVDLKLFKALEEQAPGLLFSRIGALQMETRTKQCAPLYAGQETCDEALAFMTSLRRSNHVSHRAEVVRADDEILPAVGGEL